MAQAGGIAALLTGQAGTLTLLVRSRTRLLQAAPPLDLPSFINQVAFSEIPSVDKPAQAFNLLTMLDEGCDQIVLMVEEAHLLSEATLRYIELAMRTAPSLQVVFAGRAESESTVALHDFNALRERLLLNPVTTAAMPSPAFFRSSPDPHTLAEPRPPTRRRSMQRFLMGGALAGALLTVAGGLADRFLLGAQAPWGIFNGVAATGGTADPIPKDPLHVVHSLGPATAQGGDHGDLARFNGPEPKDSRQRPDVSAPPPIKITEGPAPLPRLAQSSGLSEAAKVPFPDTQPGPPTTPPVVASEATVPVAPVAVPPPEELAAAVDVPKPAMIAVGGTTFRMGSKDDRSEEPVHTVAVARFSIAEHATTVREWQACVRAGVCTLQPLGRPQDPVTNVSWDDAQQFSGWLSGVTGQHYRLPTEAEWEYAARGGTSTRYFWGDAVLPDHASCRGCSSTPPSLEAPPWVGANPPNQFGLYGLGGGVAEWVADCWHGDYTGAPSNGTAWSTAGCRTRVLRGGSWMEDAQALATASREFYDTSVRYPTHGFRVARSETMP